MSPSGTESIDGSVRIIDLRRAGPAERRQTAQLLVDAFRDMAPDAWPDLVAADAEIEEGLSPDRIGRIAVGEHGDVLGWIGGIPSYGGKVWEIHPLAVRPESQGRGIGRALVAHLEDLVAERGGVTLWLGSDDEAGMTSLGGVDLYPNVLEKLKAIRNLKRHPFEFYRRIGFEVVGVMPDANGFGKPDILLAKRVTRSAAAR